MNRLEASIFLIPIALGSTSLLYLSMYNENFFSPFTDNGTYETPIAIVLLISFLYFMIDFVLMIVRYNPKDNIYFLHHTVGLLSILFVYFKYYHIIKYLLSFLMYELSTPFLYISLECHRKGITNIFSKIINIIFFISYTLVRILFGTYLLFHLVPVIYALDSPFQYLMLLPIILQLLNYWWYYKIILYQRKK